MKKVLVILILVFIASIANAQLVENWDFADGTDWYTDGGGAYDAVNDEFTVGWWEPVALWQTTFDTFADNTVYTMEVVARNLDGGADGLQLAIYEEVGFADVITFDYFFSGSGYETIQIQFDTTGLGLSGVGIGVGVRMLDPDAGLGWVGVQSISLVPEPATMALLGLGGLALRRRKR